LNWPLLDGVFTLTFRGWGATAGAEGGEGMKAVNKRWPAESFERDRCERIRHLSLPFFFVPFTPLEERKRREKKEREKGEKR
jgi:hypothetical protein